MKSIRVFTVGLAVFGTTGLAWAQEGSPTPDTAASEAQVSSPATTAAQPEATAAETTPVVEKEKPVAEEPKTKLSGKLFGDITHRTNVDEAGKTAKDKRVGGNGTGVDLKRFYFGIGHKFDKTWSAEFISDIGDQNGRYDVFVKKAYVEAKLAKEAFFRLGSANMPWVPFVEDIYGYRYVENILIDRLKFGTSADWGLHFGGDALGGKLGYALSGVNGGGYGNPSRSESQELDFEGRVSVNPVEGLTLAAGGYRGKLAKQAPTKHIAMRTNGLVAYNTKRFGIGAEYFQAANWMTVDKPKQDRSRGASAWASVLVYEPVSVFGRYDWAKMSLDLNPDLVDTYVLGGVEYKVNKAVNLALAYKTETVKDGQVKSSNGTVGTKVKGEKGKYDEYGLWAQYKF